MRTLLVLLALTAVASAEPTVLALDGKDIYIDLGAKDGVGTGSELELLHEIVVTDPVTKHELRDRFALGKLVVVKAGDKVCVARAGDELVARVMPGDRVSLLSGKRTFQDPWAERVAQTSPAPTTAAPRAPGAPPLDHAVLARDAWQATLGQPPEQRAARWLQLLADDPESPYRGAIAAEVLSLRKQIRERDAAVARARSTTPGDHGPRIAELARQLQAPGPLGAPTPLVLAAPVDRAVPARPLALAFLATSPADVAHAWLYVRRRGQPGFRRVELARDGDAYLRATIDADLVAEPGVEWYVETPTGAALGSHEQPMQIEVDRIVVEPPPARDRSHVDLHVDYVDWTGKRTAGYDQYYQAEGDFTYRFLEPVYAVRLGFGTLSGVGGPKQVLDHDPTNHCLDDNGVYRCTAVTFSYVYTELEYRLATNVAVMLRPQIGTLTTNAMTTGTDTCDRADAAAQGCRFLTGFGARARLRLGEEAGTNLVLGAGFSRGVGTLFEAAYHWLPAQVVPVQITVQVTDQPVLEDFGVRLIADVGYRNLSWFYPSVRVSYQARDIVHTGASGGLALNFDW